MATAKNVYIRVETIKKLEDIIRLNPTDGVASSIIDTAVSMYLDKLQNKKTETPKDVDQLVLNKQALRAAVIVLTNKLSVTGQSYNEKMESLINAVTEFVTTIYPDKIIDSKLLNPIFDALSIISQSTPVNNENSEPKPVIDDETLNVLLKTIIGKYVDLSRIRDYDRTMFDLIEATQHFLSNFDIDKWNISSLTGVHGALIPFLPTSLDETIGQNQHSTQETPAPTTFQFQLEPWETKVVEEKKELDKKTIELAGVLTKQIPSPPELSNVNGVQLGLLQQQYSAMVSQSNILNERILVFMVDKICNAFKIQPHTLNRHIGSFQSPGNMPNNSFMNAPYPFSAGHPTPRFQYDPWGVGNHGASQGLYEPPVTKPTGRKK